MIINSAAKLKQDFQDGVQSAPAFMVDRASSAPAHMPPVKGRPPEMNTMGLPRAFVSYSNTYAVKGALPDFRILTPIAPQPQMFELVESQRSRGPLQLRHRVHTTGLVNVECFGIEQSC